MGGQQIFRHDESAGGCVIKYSGRREIRYTDDILALFPDTLED